MAGAVFEDSLDQRGLLGASAGLSARRRGLHGLRHNPLRGGFESPCLGWEPKVRFKELVKIMVEHDLELAKREAQIASLPRVSNSPFA